MCGDLRHRVRKRAAAGRDPDRGGHATVLAGPLPGLAAVAAQFVPLPLGSDLKYAIAGAVPFQLLADHLSVARGMSPDYPRNLSTTLTVD